jgi:hypothetical protein
MTVRPANRERAVITSRTTPSPKYCSRSSQPALLTGSTARVAGVSCGSIARLSVTVPTKRYPRRDTVAIQLSPIVRLSAAT